MAKKRQPGAASLDSERMRRLADLSRLSFASQEQERLKRELSSILDYFAVIDKAGGLDEAGAAAPQAVSATPQMREDVARPSTPAEVMAGVPQKTKDGLVRAPRVF